MVYIQCFYIQTNGYYLKKYPLSKYLFMSEIHVCVKEYPNLSSSIFHLHDCLTNTLYLCLVEYTASNDTVYTYNSSRRSLVSHGLLQTQHPVLPSQGYRLRLCGTIGNIVPFLKPQKWTIYAPPSSYVNILWLKFTLPLSMPQCHFTGVVVTQFVNIMNRIIPKSSIFCGSRRS